MEPWRPTGKFLSRTWRPYSPYLHIINCDKACFKGSVAARQTRWVAFAVLPSYFWVCKRSLSWLPRKLRQARLLRYPARWRFHRRIARGLRHVDKRVGCRISACCEGGQTHWHSAMVRVRVVCGQAADTGPCNCPGVIRTKTTAGTNYKGDNK